MRPVMTTIVIIGLGLVLGGMGTRYWLVKRMSPESDLTKITELPTRAPKPSTEFYSFDLPPKTALYGSIVRLRGENWWTTRTATKEAQLRETDKITQGEVIRTGELSEVELEFKEVLYATLSANTRAEFIKTTPDNLVINHTMGSIKLTKLSAFLVSVRNRQLLIQLNEGSGEVSVDPLKPLVVVRSNEGSMTIGFNDVNNMTVLKTIEAGKMATYNVNTKKVVIK